MNDRGVAALEIDGAHDVIGRLWSDLWTGEGRQAVESGLAQALQGKISRFSGRAATAKGESGLRQVVVAPVFGEDGRVARILVQSRDISQSRMADERIAGLLEEIRAGAEKLRASEAKFRIIADTMPQLVWSTRPDGFTDYYNARWYEFTGAPEGSTDGDGWTDLFHPDDRERARSRWRHSLETGEPYEIEYRLRHVSGKYRWTLGRALPIRDAAGRITRWFATCMDIDDSRRDAELLALLGQELSHRIKNIFAIVQGLISLSARQQPEARDFAAALRSRVAALGRAHDYARPHTQDSQQVVGDTTLHALLGEILKPYPAMESGGIAITGTDLKVDDKSATPLALVVHELATNAMKYGALSSEGGRVSIATSMKDGVCRLTWKEEGGPRITTAPDSTGFGSRLSRIAVESHLGGTIDRQWNPEGLIVQIICSEASLHR